MPQHSGARAVTSDLSFSRTRRPSGVTPFVLAAALGTGLVAAPAHATPYQSEQSDQSDPTDASKRGGSPSGASEGHEAGVRTRTLGAPVRALTAAPSTTYRVKAGDTVSHIALRYGVSQAAIIKANRLDSRAFIRAGQVLTIPGQAAPAPSRASRAAARTAPAPAPAPTSTTYRVKAGDTVSHIAARTGLSSAAIIAANGLDRSGFIRVGQVLELPTSVRATTASAGGTAAKPPSAPTTRYTVQAGDTVSQIALRAGVTQAAIIAVNKLPSNGFIRVGQVLTLPGKAAPAPSGGGTPAKPASASSPSSAGSESYTVKAGDTLSHIAARQGTTVATLRALNPTIDARGTIRVGQTINVPKPAAPMPNSFAGRTYPEATVRAATVNRDVLASRNVPSREQMRQIVADTARKYGVDPALAQAIAFQESGFNQRAVSPANAVGAMQVIPSSGQWASDMAGRRLDLLDAHDNATAGVLIIRANLGMAEDLPQAIAAYYQGMGSVRKNGMYADTRRYVANIQTLMARYR
jgi:LysM repeat protein